MNNNNDVSRRSFLQLAAAAGGSLTARISGAVLLAMTQTACEAASTEAEFAVLRPDEARDFAAIAARIIPTTDTPGANEAGVIYFFDAAFAAEMQDDLSTARTGLATFNTALREAGFDQPFAALSAAEQDGFLRSQERSRFFALTRQMTLFGFFAMSSYGGNRNHVGWDAIGFHGHHTAWTYPFGYYDAEYAREQARDE